MKVGKNSEGYLDPTASAAIGQVSREESEADKRAYDLIKVLKFIIRSLFVHVVLNWLNGFS